MLLGARQFFERRGGGWQNPYVTDGLIAMWDGEWNAGPGVHDAATTTWKDLVGERDLDCVNVSFDGIWAVFAGNGYALSEASWLTAENRTIEAVFQSDSNLNQMDVVNVSISDLTNYNYFRGCISGYSGNWIVCNGRGYENRPMYRRDDSAVQSGCSMSVLYSSNSVLDCLLNCESVELAGTEYRIAGYKGACIGAANATTRHFVGKIGCVRLYSRALTAAEIAANYAVDKERFYLP